VYAVQVSLLPAHRRESVIYDKIAARPSTLGRGPVRSRRRCARWPNFTGAVAPDSVHGEFVGSTRMAARLHTARTLKDVIRAPRVSENNRDDRPARGGFSGLSRRWAFIDDLGRPRSTTTIDPSEIAARPGQSAVCWRTAVQGGSADEYKRVLRSHIKSGSPAFCEFRKRNCR